MAGKGVWPVKKFSVSPDRLKELKFQFLGSYLKKKFKLLKFVRGTSLQSRFNTIMVKQT